jgi:hypothetical protein
LFNAGSEVNKQGSKDEKNKKESQQAVDANAGRRWQGGLARAETMRATRTTRATRTGRNASRTSRAVKRRTPVKRTAAKSTKPVKPVKVVAAPPEPVLYKLCKNGWAVIVERIPNAQGTRFVCPFCPKSHRVPGPVRGFKKMRRAQWVRLRRVEE